MSIFKASSSFPNTLISLLRWLETSFTFFCLFVRFKNTQL